MAFGGALTMLPGGWRDERGQALLEMALVLPILILLLLGVVELGQVTYSYITVNNAARAGARVASVGGTDSDIAAAVQQASPALTSADLTVNISPVQGSRQSGQPVTVDVRYPVTLVMPIPQGIIPNPVIVEAAETMRVE